MTEQKLGTRRATVRIETESIQPGSWVEYVPLNVGERFKAQTIGAEIVRNHIKRWNFSDDNGDPIPSPTDDPDAFDKLTVYEYRGLTEIVAGFYGPQDTLKN
jgi:hypothetical protein